ncbi:hypothetical protein [Actinomadura sp. 9N215]|uniref:hypothetical protein n=1 Tax=Actinomadura sp. 9N215 TaxID=3375150 RepID=UPI0037A39846
MALSRRTRIVVLAAGLAGAGTLITGGAALADSGPGPGRTHLQIVEYQHATADTPGRDCPGHEGGRAPAEGVQ